MTRGALIIGAPLASQSASATEKSMAAQLVGTWRLVRALTLGTGALAAVLDQRTGRVLALDTCFRAHDPRAQYDTYEILDDSGVEWVVIEDTGKVWPTLELKAGFLVWGERCRLPLLDAFSDVLLSISPVVLLLIQRLAEDGVHGGYRELHRLIAENRARLADPLAGGPLSVADPELRISVARVAWDESGPDADVLYRELAREGLNILPCGPFHWARPEEGRRMLRVALGRRGADVSAAARMLAEAARRWGRRRGGGG